MEWKLTTDPYSGNPLPREAAIPKCLLLNIAPAFQTERRAPALYTRSWISTSHMPNMVSPAAYQPVTPEGGQCCLYRPLGLTLSWKAEWKLDWPLVAADPLVTNSYYSSQYDLEARPQCPSQIAVLWTINFRWRMQGHGHESGKRKENKNHSQKGGKGSRKEDGRGTDNCVPPPPHRLYVCSVTAAAAQAKRQTGVYPGFLQQTQAASRDCRERLPGPLDILPSLLATPPSPGLGHLELWDAHQEPKDYGPGQNNKQEPASG